MIGVITALTAWLIQSGKGKLQSSKFSVAAGATHQFASPDLTPVGQDTAVVLALMHVSGVATAGASTYTMLGGTGGNLSGYLDNGDLGLKDVLNVGAIQGSVVNGEATATIYVTLQFVSISDNVYQEIVTEMNKESQHNPFGLTRGNRY